jgi:hypothetical protein
MALNENLEACEKVEKYMLSVSGVRNTFEGAREFMQKIARIDVNREYGFNMNSVFSNIASDFRVLYFLTRDVRSIAETTKTGTQKVKSEFTAGSKTVEFWLKIVE